MLAYQNGEFVNGPDTAFATLDEAKDDRSAVVDIVAMSLRNRITSNTSPAEMASWPIKLAEAQAGGGPMLALEAQYRGVTEAALVQLVLQNADDLSRLEAQISGISGMHRDAIAALQTVEDVCAYDMRSDWPEV